MANSGQYTDETLATRRRLSEAMLKQGMDASPIGSHWQGAARLSQALFGGMGLNDVSKEQKAGEAETGRMLGNLPGLGGAPSASPMPASAPAQAPQSPGWATSVTPTGGTTQPVAPPPADTAPPAPAGGGMPQAPQMAQAAPQATPAATSAPRIVGADEIKTLIANPRTRAVGLQVYMAARKHQTDRGAKYGKQGTIVEEGGNFYTVQFAEDGTRKIEPLKLDGKGLAPAKGVKQVGSDLVSTATGTTVRDMTPQIEAKDAAEARGQLRGKAQFSLPSTTVKAQDAINVIEQIIGSEGRELAAGEKAKPPHAALKYGTGVLGVAPSIPGTKQAEFVALHNQLTGKAFLEAFESLKGGGQITEVEGKKATDAIARLDRKMSPEDYTTALRDLREVINKGVERSRIQTSPVGSPKQFQGRVGGGDGAQGMIPPQAVMDLKSDPSPMRVQQFEQVFGPGSARQFLGGQ